MVVTGGRSPGDRLDKRFSGLSHIYIHLWLIDINRINHRISWLINLSHKFVNRK